MIGNYVIGIIGIVGLMMSWFWVQKIWKKAFSDYQQEEDALAGRTRCTNCTCTTACELKNRNTKEN